jgi:NAD(P)-dependent dehydrogenase (short-subunit alcohol dehydrogenase family)
MARVVVTGANRGIGLELVRGLTGRGDAVIAACRQSSPELDALGAEIHEGVDVAVGESVEAFAAGVSAGPLDILINNAGVLTSESIDDLDWGRIRRQFEVNSLGPLRVTAALLPRLKNGGKVAIVSSRVGSLEDNSSGGMYGYRMSKAAVNMAGVNLAHDLKSRGIAVVILHPGYVRTGMTGGQGGTGPAEAARGLIDRIDSLRLKDTGSFWHAEGYPLPW